MLPTAALILLTFRTTTDVPFNVPTTAEAQRAAPLLSRAAQALNDYLTKAGYAGTSPLPHLANLWVYPTDTSDTVFAQFNLVRDDAATADSVVHLVLIKMHHDQIQTLRFLTPASVTWTATGLPGLAASPPVPPD